LLSCAGWEILNMRARGRDAIAVDATCSAHVCRGLPSAVVATDGTGAETGKGRLRPDS